MWGETKWIDDYARKEWSGMLNDYYAVRWQKYFDYVMLAMQNNQEFDHDSAINDIFRWEYDWSDQHKEYQDKPNGNSIEVSKMFLNKYF